MSLKASILLKCLLIVLCTFSIISSIYTPPFEDYTKNHGHLTEEYEPSYFLKFQSIDDIIRAADAKFGSANQNSIKYFDYVAGIIRKRFYHGYSYYSLADNPIAYIAGEVTSGNLSAIVIPDDIMKHPMAACSQQAIVMIEIFKRKGINFRKVCFLHHFATEAMIEGKWRYFDTDMEPDFRKGREPLADLLSSGQFDKAYASVGIDLASLHQLLGSPRYGKVNEFPAPHAQLFHKLTFFFNSKYFLLSALLLMIFSTVNLPLPRTFSISFKKQSMPLQVVETN